MNTKTTTGIFNHKTGKQDIAAVAAASKIVVEYSYEEHQWRGATVRADLPGVRSRCSVSVYPDATVEGLIQGYGVNWGAFGTVSPEATRKFTEVLNVAALLAVELGARFAGQMEHELRAKKQLEVNPHLAMVA